MKRYCMIIELKLEKIEEYKKLHTDVWPDVLDTIKQCNISNYSIFLRQMPDSKHYLFSYFEYLGNNFEADMDKMAADESTQKWWDICKPLQQPLPGVDANQWWADTEEVFHYD